MDFTRLDSDAQLRDLYEPPQARALRKDIGRIDELAARLIAASPLLFIASYGADGSCDITPRGGEPGFVTVLDEHHVAIPDATGNQRLDTLSNIVATARAGLIFVIGGRETTLRVNGPAAVSADPGLLDRLTPVGKPPRTAIVVESEEVYAHCPKALIRSHIWDPETWPDASDLPSPAEVALAHRRDPELTLAEVEREQAESLAKRLE